MRVGGYSLLWAGRFLFCLYFFSSFVPWWDPSVLHCIPVCPFGCSFDEYICFYSKKKKKKIVPDISIYSLSNMDHQKILSKASNQFYWCSFHNAQFTCY